jgi:shikimate dehydrogenase
VISGDTRLVGVIGSPVRHSLSPRLHNAAFAASGLDWVSVAFEVAPQDLSAAVAGMGALGIAGLSVTMPHKGAVVELMDVLTPQARQLAAVNCITRQSDGRLAGSNTDGGGFLDSLADNGFEVAGRRAVVLGAGGAARAVALALGEAEAAEVVIVNRSASAAEYAAGLVAGGRGRVGAHADITAADLVVNGTPLGMDGEGLPCDPGLLRVGQTVVDLIYHPAQTPWVKQAAARGAATIGGLGMLVHQAARAWTGWTGQPAPVEAMLAAVDVRVHHSDSANEGR